MKLETKIKIGLFILICGFLIRACFKDTMDNKQKKEVLELANIHSIETLTYTLGTLPIHKKINLKNEIYWFYLNDGLNSENKETLTKKAQTLIEKIGTESKEITINFTDDKMISTDIENLTNDNYLNFSEHYISNYTRYSDGTSDNEVIMYPYINKKYNDLGGKNYKLIRDQYPN